jgi:hypothetical protein
MATFDQIKEMHKLTQTLARMDLPNENEWDADDAITRTLEDATKLYDLIEEARSILKQGKPKRQPKPKPEPQPDSSVPLGWDSVES